MRHWNLQRYFHSLYFNPRTHVGCDIGHNITILIFVISIHAPTWGATAKNPSKSYTFKISIHAPTWGATLEFTKIFSQFTFQSTHPRGVRLTPKRHPVGSSLFQSTHPRGVRQKQLTNKIMIKNFNPRTHVGCDGTLRVTLSFTRNFNPRTHVGCDC